MADSPCNATFKATATYSATSLGSCKGGGIDFQVVHTKTRPGTRISPAIGVDEIDCTAEVIHEELVTPIAVATAAASLAFTLTQLDGGTNTVTMLKMRPAGATMDFRSKPYSQTSKFTLDAADTEITAPVTVA